MLRPAKILCPRNFNTWRSGAGFIWRENWLCSTLWFWSPRMYSISSISIWSPSINAFWLPTILNFYHSNQIWHLKFSRSKHKTMTHCSNNKSSIETLLQKYFGHLWFRGLVTKNCPSSISIRSPSINDFRLPKISTIFTIQIKFGASNLVAPSISKQNNDS